LKMLDEPASEDVASQIAVWASLQFVPAEIARGLELDPDEAQARMYDETDPWGLAYARGQLMAEAKVRKAILTLAGQGSSPAQAAFVKMVEERRAKDADGRRRQRVRSE